MLKRSNFLRFRYLLVLALSGGIAYVQPVGCRNAVAKPTNVSLIRDCVASEHGLGRDGSACIGRFYETCRARRDNKNTHDQLECLEREFVFWNRILNDEFRALTEALKGKDKAKRLKVAQFHWTKYQQSECRLPYSLFGENSRMLEYGMRCSIERTARRVFEILEWRALVEAGMPLVTR